MAELCTYALRKQHAWRAHTSKGEAQAGQGLSGHALPITPSSPPSVHFSYPPPVLVSIYFPIFLFKSKVHFREEPKQAKHPLQQLHEQWQQVFVFFVCSLQKSFTSTCSRQPLHPNETLTRPQTWWWSIQIAPEESAHHQRPKIPRVPEQLTLGRDLLLAWGNHILTCASA